MGVIGLGSRVKVVCYSLSSRLFVGLYGRVGGVVSAIYGVARA